MPKQAEILAIIPARLGSSEVKNKNIRILCGKPLLYYSIKASLDSLTTRTIVSTDSVKIKKIAQKFGAEVPFLRPKKFASNFSTAFSVIRHCLEYLETNEDYFPHYVAYLQPTSPFRKASDIDKGIKKIMKSNTTSLLGVTDVTNTHPYWTFRMNKDERLSEFIKIKNKPERRQDLPKLYRINTALYITRAKFFKNKPLNHLIFDINNSIGLKMNNLNSYDVNTEMDFKIAEFFCKQYHA